MRFKEGQKVRVKNGLKAGEYYGDVYFNHEMPSYCGKTYTIEQVLTGYYYLDEIASWVFSDEMLEPVDFTKSDLKNGMIVEYRCGSRRMVVGECLRGITTFSRLEDFSEDLCAKKGLTNLDIMKIFDVPNEVGTVRDVLDYNRDGELLWERDAPVPMTLKEIEEKLGHKIKIVEPEN